MAARAPAPLRALLPPRPAPFRPRPHRRDDRALRPPRHRRYWQLCERLLDYQARWLAALDAAPGGPLDALPVTGGGAARAAPRRDAEWASGAYTCLYMSRLARQRGRCEVRADEECATRVAAGRADRTARR